MAPSLTRFRGRFLGALLAVSSLSVGACAPPAAEDPASEPPGADPVEEEVTFSSGPDTLHGTFASPADTAEPAPAALIISGSGPTDRDGNGDMRPNADTNLNFARVLADAGVASLRYDKLGSGRTGTASWDEDEAIPYQVFEEHVAAAYRELAERPEVDPQRLLVLGHSEGSLFALRSAEFLQEEPPRALILAAPLGTRYLDLIDRQVTEQMRYSETTGNLEPEEVTDILAATRQAVVALRSGEDLPEDLPSWLMGIFGETNRDFLTEADSFDPRDLAAGVSEETPVLVLWGAEDAQVTEEEVERLAAGLREGTRVDVPGADHVFRTRADAHLLDEDRPFSPDAATAVTEFVAEVL